MGIIDAIKKQLFYLEVKSELESCILCVADYLAYGINPNEFDIPKGSKEHYENMVRCLDVAIKQSKRPKEAEGFKMLKDRYEALIFL